MMMDKTFCGLSPQTLILPGNPLVGHLWRRTDLRVTPGSFRSRVADGCRFVDKYSAIPVDINESLLFSTYAIQ